MAALTEWDETVGVLRPDLTISVRQGEPGEGHFQGSSTCPKSGAVITLYQGTFWADEFSADVRHVVLHELVHVHKGCGDVDHVSNRRSLMYFEVLVENLRASPDPADVDVIRQAWIR